MNRAIFLDRDGTINVEKHYLYREEDFEFLPGVVSALKRLQDAGYLLIIITNQSGIARGYYTEEDFLQLNRWMIDSLKRKGVSITAVYYCPHLPNAPIGKYRNDCDCRKPKLGLFEKAVADYDINLSESFAVGDKIRDCAICEETSCQGFLIGNNECAEIIDDVKKRKRKNIKYAVSLKDCADKIVTKSE